MDTFLSSVMSNPASVWFVIGFALLAIEIVAFGLGSGVLLFGSIGALITGALLWFGVVPSSWLVSVGCFAIASAIATAILWVPLKKMQSGAELGNDQSSDLIGFQFRLGGDITHAVPGSHRYSGVEWRVKISDHTSESTIAAGSRVKVAGVDAGVFYVVPD